jgi:hypothetical protein
MADTINIGLLKRTLAQIEANPHLWNPGAGRSETPHGTAYGFAQWAAVLDGATFPVPLPQEWTPIARYISPQGGLTLDRVIPPGGGDTVHVKAYAIRVLGIDEGAAKQLFDPWLKSVDELRRIVADLVARHGAR